ncbi:MAG: ABC transporter ATP-binding protein [Candidatus Enteromonas sp.]
MKVAQALKNKDKKCDAQIEAYHQEIVKVKVEGETLCMKISQDVKKDYKALRLAKKEAKAKVRLRKKEIDARHKEKLAPIMARLFSHFREAYGELILEHRRYLGEIRVTHREAKERALEIMKEVGIPEPERRFNQYPFEFSGGMRQRIVIAIALTAEPDVLICDEPTTALDVTIQAQILELINRLKKTHHMSVIFITHDLGVVANMADRVAVMYAGKIVEYGTSKDVFYSPAHPYTWALLSSIPDVDSKEKLDAIPGTPPNMLFPPKGDAFALRSKYAMAVDFKKEPPMFQLSPTHFAATWLLDERAPKVEMPKIVSTRIENAKKRAAMKEEQQ